MQTLNSERAGRKIAAVRGVSGFLAIALLLSACTPPEEAADLTPAAPPLPEAGPVSPAPTPTSGGASAIAAGGSAVVAYVKDGDLLVWDEASGESRTIFESGDVVELTMSDDGEVIAFLRRQWFEQPELWEQFSLWAVSPSGEDARELVSAEILRQRLIAGPVDSTGIAEVEWIPRTHRLVYSGAKYFAPGQDKPAAEEVYLVDTDTLADNLLAPGGGGVRVSGVPDGPQFVPSPDGKQVALLSGSELSFVNADGSNLRQPALTYPPMGSGDVPFVPTGVWTQDSLSFLINAPIESNPPANILNFTITRVPVDGSPSEPIATVVGGNPVSVAFSPDGQYAAFGSIDPQRPGWIITPLANGAGPVVVRHDFHLDYINIHWSPSGDAYVIQENSLWRLCPSATQGSQVCGSPIHLESIVESIQWLDKTRFLIVTRNPDTFATHGLFLGTLDGKMMPIMTWSETDSSHSFAAVLVPEVNTKP